MSDSDITLVFPYPLVKDSGPRSAAFEEQHREEGQEQDPTPAPVEHHPRAHFDWNRGKCVFTKDLIADVALD